MKKILLVVIICLMRPTSVWAEAAMPELKWEPISKITSPIIKRAGLYDYQGSSIREDNGHVKVWDCGQEGVGIGSDAIVYTEFDGQGNRIDGPKVVMTANHGDNLSYDNLHACSPSVVKYSNTNIYPDEYYLMFYECGPMFYNKCDGTPASRNEGNPSGAVTCNPDVRSGQASFICSASSADGIHWRKYSSELWNIQNGYKHYGNDKTPPTPIVKIGSKHSQNCGWDETNFKNTGKMSMYLQNEKCIDANSNYGVGQVSAFVKKLGGTARELWLYYFDSRGDFFDKGNYLIKFDDGIHPKIAPERLNMVSGAGIGMVKYYDGQILGHPGIYLSSNPIFNNNFFSYSFDGISWVTPDYSTAWWNTGGSTGQGNPGLAVAQPQIQAFALGMATNNYCPLQGHVGFLGDKYGYVNSLSSLTFFSGEGDMGATCDSVQKNLGSWGIYSITGRLVPKVSPTNTPVPPTPTKPKLVGDYDGNGVVALGDFGEWKKRYLAVPPTMTLADFGVWKKAYLGN